MVPLVSPMLIGFRIRRDIDCARCKADSIEGMRHLRQDRRAVAKGLKLLCVKLFHVRFAECLV